MNLGGNLPRQSIIDGCCRIWIRSHPSVVIVKRGRREYREVYSTIAVSLIPSIQGLL